MKAITIQEKEMQAGRIITITNIVIGIIALAPALLSFLFTADAFFRTGSSGTDRFPDPPADLQTKILFSIASLSLLLFYRYIFLNPFSNNEKKLIRNKRLIFWLQVIIINLIALALFIYFMGDHFFPDTLHPENEGQLIVYLFIYLPFIPLFISSIGCFYNLKQNNFNNISNEN